MANYRKHITIEDLGLVILSDLPFRAGQRVEIVVMAVDDDSATRVEEGSGRYRAGAHREHKQEACRTGIPAGAAEADDLLVAFAGHGRRGGHRQVARGTSGVGTTRRVELSQLRRRR